MKPLSLFAFAALLAVMGAGRGWASEARPSLVTVELFTSQGCSSCPPADKLLGELAAQDDVLPLTFAVDYWDYLGWRDTLARTENTKRQYAYAKALKLQPYTPQMVVDGRVNVRGNDVKAVHGVIEDRQRRRNEALPISFEPGGDSVTILIGEGSKAQATVWLLRYRDSVTVNIERGENEGRTFTYANVVQSMMPIGMWTGASARFVLPRRDLTSGANGEVGQRFAVIVQTENTGPILGAAKLPTE